MAITRINFTFAVYSFASLCTVMLLFSIFCQLTVSHYAFPKTVWLLFQQFHVFGNAVSISALLLFVYAKAGAIHNNDCAAHNSLWHWFRARQLHQSIVKELAFASAIGYFGSFLYFSSAWIVVDRSVIQSWEKPFILPAGYLAATGLPFLIFLLIWRRLHPLSSNDEGAKPL